MDRVLRLKLEARFWNHLLLGHVKDTSQPRTSSDFEFVVAQGTPTTTSIPQVVEEEPNDTGLGLPLQVGFLNNDDDPQSDSTDPIPNINPLMSALIDEVSALPEIPVEGVGVSTPETLSAQDVPGSSSASGTVDPRKSIFPDASRIERLEEKLVKITRGLELLQEMVQVLNVSNPYASTVQMTTEDSNQPSPVSPEQKRP